MSFCSVERERKKKRENGRKNISKFLSGFRIMNVYVFLFGCVVFFIVLLSEIDDHSTTAEKKN